MKLGVRPGARVLLGDLCSKLDVLTDGAAKRLVVGQTGIVESLQVDLDEPLTLLVGDLQVAMNVDDVPKTELIGKSWRAPERLTGKPGQAFDMAGNAVREQLLEHEVGERLGVEELLEPVQALVTARMLIQRLVHGLGLSRSCTVKMIAREPCDVHPASATHYAARAVPGGSE
jgi:hypothetical protein